MSRRGGRDDEVDRCRKAVYNAHPVPDRPGSPGLLRRLARRWYLGVAVAAAAGFAVPVALVARGTARARACIAAYEAPRGPELPDCRGEIRWFVTPSRLPWTATPARYRAEEISMRQAVAAYTDAAVGHPDPGELGRAGDALAAAAKIMRTGSQRVALEELGRAVGAPDLGRAAMLLGDRRTLIARANEWDDWDVRARTLEAALIDGDVPGAAAIARSYAGWDPRDEGLRVPVAAMLCLGGGAARGLALLGAVQEERAKQRHESWARNWGDVRAMIVACADEGGVEAPPQPERSEAGALDLVEVRAALRLRQLARARPGDSPALREAAFNVITLLKGSRVLPGARVRLLAALLAVGRPMDPELAAQLARPHADEGEDPIVPSAASFSALDWIDGARGMRPSVPAALLRDAAAKLRSMAKSSEIVDADRLGLEAAATAAAIDAARVLARGGDAEGAVAVLDGEGERLSVGARALGRSTAWYLAAEPARALAELEPEPEGLAAEPALLVVFRIQRAELLASTGRRTEAAREAARADDAAAALGDRPLALRARWTRVAFEASPPSPPLPAGARWPWVGSMAAEGDWLTAEAESDATLARALSFWAAARSASPEDRRAIRYAALRQHRGDAPRAFAPYLLLAAELLAPGEGDVEVWLDAFSATSGRALGIRAYAWARAEAARFRGDTAAATRWTERYRALVKIASRPGSAELAAALGL
jgi:hypothetical protein